MFDWKEERPLRDKEGTSNYYYFHRCNIANKHSIVLCATVYISVALLDQNAAPSHFSSRFNRAKQRWQRKPEQNETENDREWRRVCMINAN